MKTQKPRQPEGELPKPKREGAARRELLLRLSDFDSQTKVSRATLMALADELGTTETQVIHLALRRLAAEILPAYEADDGPLTQAQLDVLRRLEPQGRHPTVCSSLFD